MNKQICLQCEGFGKIFAIKGTSINCDMCAGSGMMKDKHVLWLMQGEVLKEIRIKNGLTLRKCALRYGIDPSNLSKMERGIIKPKNYFIEN